MNEKFYSPWSRYLFADCHAIGFGKYRLITISGMGSEDRDDGSILHPEDVKGQTACAYEKIQYSLRRAGAELSNAVRVVVYLTDIRDKEDYEFIQAQYFDRQNMPVHTLLVVHALAWPGMRVEVEVTAIVEAS